MNELATKWNVFNIIGKQILKLDILFVQAYNKKIISSYNATPWDYLENYLTDKL